MKSLGFCWSLSKNTGDETEEDVYKNERKKDKKITDWSSRQSSSDSEIDITDSVRCTFVCAN